MPAFNINRVVLVGRLTREPELRSLPSGRSVCSLRVACNGVRRDDDGELVERAQYFDVTVFGPAADNVANYMRRGRRVGVDGRLDWREWETDDQQRRQAVSIVADTVQFLDATGEGDDENGPSADAGASGEELAGVGAEEGDLSF